VVKAQHTAYHRSLSSRAHAQRGNDVTIRSTRLSCYKTDVADILRVITKRQQAINPRTHLDVYAANSVHLRDPLYKSLKADRFAISGFDLMCCLLY